MNAWRVASLSPLTASQWGRSPSRNWRRRRRELDLIASFAGEQQEEKKVGETKILQGVDQYKITEPLFEGVRVILNYRGEKYSPAYVAGISSAAFRIAGPCPCAPTCDTATWPGALVKQFGYEVEQIEFKSADKTADLPKALERIQAEIRAGRPVLAWNAFTTAEFDVVCGYDTAKGELIGRGSYLYMQTGDYVHAAQNRIIEDSVAPALGVFIIGKKTGEFDARKAEIAALREAVAHAHGMATTLPGMPSGLRCYDAWIASYEKRGTLTRAKSRDEKQDLGWVKVLAPDDFYPFIIYPSTHRAAGDFLKEIAPKYPEAKSFLELAAEHFAKDAAALEAARTDRGERGTEPNEEQCNRVAGHLREARAMYELGIDEIAAALRKIGGTQNTN
jgi:hypothetical protein